MGSEDIFLRTMMDYDSHEIEDNDVYILVQQGDLFPEQYEQITGREYID